MSDLDELYQEVILDHTKNPRNYGKLEATIHQAEGNNPLCGDRIIVYLNVKNNSVKDISFQGSGCAISKASASIMTTLLKGKTIVEAKTYFDNFRTMTTTGKHDFTNADKLKVLAGVYRFPSRVKCAMLAWHTMINSIEKSTVVVSTEK